MTNRVPFKGSPSWLLLLIPLIAGAVQTQERTAKDIGTSQATKKVQTHGQGTLANPLVVKRLDAEETPERRDQMRAERGEKAANEERLVLWTERLGVATITLALIAAVQAGLFIWQLRLVRRSFIDSRISAKAALKSANIAETAAKMAQDSGERQLRAYVCLGGTEHIKNSLATELPAFQIQIKNSGKTPAYRIRSWRGIGIHERPLLNKLNPMPGGATETDTVLGADADFMIPIRRQSPFRPEDLAGVKAGTHALYVFGRVEYEDAFGRQHFTNFCLFESEGGRGAGLQHSPKGNDAD